MLGCALKHAGPFMRHRGLTPAARIAVWTAPWETRERPIHQPPIYLLDYYTLFTPVSPRLLLHADTRLDLIHGT